MLGNFFLTAFRGLRRRKLHSLINTASLAIGLTVFALAFLYVKRELSYDRSWPDAERIHRLLVRQNGMPGMPDGLFDTVVGRAYPSIQQYFSQEIDKSTRLFPSRVRPEDKPSNPYRNLVFVDPEFMEIFRLEVLEGNLEPVLREPGFIALEENHAATLGEAAKIGDSLRMTSPSGGVIEYQVGAIYRLPPTISPLLNFEMLTLIDDYSLPLFGEARRFATWESFTQVWLTLKPGLDTASFNAMQPAFMEEIVHAFDESLGPDRRISDHLIWRWQPVTEMHFNPSDQEARSGAGDFARVLTVAAVGLLVLLVGCSNSISLSLASALERRREIGIRKAAGALRRDIRCTLWASRSCWRSWRWFRPLRWWSCCCRPSSVC